MTADHRAAEALLREQMPGWWFEFSQHGKAGWRCLAYRVNNDEYYSRVDVMAWGETDLAASEACVAAWRNAHDARDARECHPELARALMERTAEAAASQAEIVRLRDAGENLRRAAVNGTPHADWVAACAQFIDALEDRPPLDALREVCFQVAQLVAADGEQSADYRPTDAALRAIVDRILKRGAAERLGEAGPRTEVQ